MSSQTLARGLLIVFLFVIYQDAVSLFEINEEIVPYIELLGANKDIRIKREDEEPIKEKPASGEEVKKCKRCPKMSEEDIKIKDECTEDIETKWGVSMKKLINHIKTEHSENGVITYKIPLYATCLFNCFLNKLNMTYEDGTLDVDKVVADIKERHQKHHVELTFDVEPIIYKCERSPYESYPKPVQVVVDFYSYGSRPGYNKETCMRVHQFMVCVNNAFLTELEKHPMNNNATQIDVKSNEVI